MRRENRRRDLKYGKPHPGDSVDTSELADEVRAVYIKFKGLFH